MKNVNRREFIKKGLFASATLLLSLTPFQKVFSKTSNSGLLNDGDSNISEDYLRLQKKAKEYFYQKDFSNAENTYRQLVTQFPTYISGYDGLAKTFYAQNKPLDAAEVYRQAYILYPEDILVCDRYARAIVRLSLGNRKLEKIFSEKINEKKLINYAANLYIDRIKETKNKDKQFLYYGLLDVKRSLEKYNTSQRRIGKPEISFNNSIDNKIENLTTKYSQKWEYTRKKKKKNDYQAKSFLEAKTRYAKSIKRAKRQLNFDDEIQHRDKEEKKYLKSLYYPVFLAALKSKTTQEVEDTYKAISKIDSNDYHSTGRVINYYRRQKMYDNLVEFQKKKHTENPTFWNAISYAQSLRLQSKKENKKQLCQKALTLYQGIELNEKDIKSYLNYHCGIIDCYQQLQMYSDVRNSVLKALEKFPLGYTPIVLSYIRSWTNEGNTDFALKAYQMILKGLDDNTLSNDPIYKYLTQLKLKVEKNGGYSVENKGYGINKENYLDIHYGLFETYKAMKNSKSKKEVLNTIIKIDPNNTFALKRL